MDLSGHPRARERDAVFLMAKVAGSSGKTPTCYVIRNLSATGACIADPGALAKEQRLVVSIGQLDAIAAEVAWARGGFAGVRFLTPIDVALARRPLVRPRLRPETELQVGWLSDTRRPYQRIWG